MFISLVIICLQPKINVSILVVILYYRFAKCYRSEKLGKVYTESLCVIIIFFTTACVSIVFSVESSI